MPTYKSFTIADMCAIRDACREMRGQEYRDGRDKGLWYEAFIRVAWDSGMRLTDQLNLEWSRLDEHGTIRIVTQRRVIEQAYPLKLDTIDAIQAIRRPDHHLIFEADVDEVRREWDGILRRAGLSRHDSDF